MPTDISTLTAPTGAGASDAACNLLQNYCRQAKLAEGKELLDIIEQVLEAPGIYVFSELYLLPNVQELKNGLHVKYYNTLTLFAYGTFKEYRTQPTEYIELNAVKQKKLQHLTIMQLAITTKQIPYDLLQKELEIDNVRRLEDIIIDAIYAAHKSQMQVNVNLQINDMEEGGAATKDVAAQTDCDMDRQLFRRLWCDKRSVHMRALLTELEPELAAEELAVETPAAEQADFGIMGDSIVMSKSEMQPSGNKDELMIKESEKEATYAILPPQPSTTTAPIPLTPSTETASAPSNPFEISLSILQSISPSILQSISPTLPLPASPPTIPPPPLPPPLNCEEPVSAPAFTKPAILPNKDMKTLNWQRIVMSDASCQFKHSAWHELPEYKVSDAEEIEKLFAAQISPKKVIKLKTSDKSVSIGKPRNVSLLKFKEEVEIRLLMHKSYDLEYLRKGLDSLDLSFDLSHLKALRKIIPIDELARQEYRSYAACIEDLIPAEQYMVNLLNIEYVQERLEVLFQMIQFKDEETACVRIMADHKEALENIMDNKELKIILSMVLATGNFLNGGNAKYERADGFGIATLESLKRLKSIKFEYSLLHYIVQKFSKECYAEKLPNACPLPSHSLFARCIDHNFINMRNIIDAMAQKRNKCLQLKSVFETIPKCSTSQFEHEFNTFIVESDIKIQNLEDKFKECCHKFKDAADFFTFKGRREKAAEFYSIWKNFLKDFETVWEEQKNEVKVKSRVILKKGKKIKTK